MKSTLEYVKDLRDAEAGEMNFEGVRSLLDGITKPQFLKVEPGTTDCDDMVGAVYGR